MLTLDGVTRRFGETAALQNVSLTVEDGCFLGVIGPSGAGKSTLLRTINRLIEPSAGRIFHEGLEVTALRGRALRDWRMKCAMIFQQFNLCGRLDVFTNVMMGRLNAMSAWRSLIKLWPEADRVRVLTALEQFGVGEIAAQRAETLSGGQQQRVAIARALVQEPRIILADEPVASLDPANAALVMEALRRINRDLGITVICNLHSLELARSYCDRIVGLSRGRVAFDGAPGQLTDAAARALYDLRAKPSGAELQPQIREAVSC